MTKTRSDELSTDEEVLCPTTSGARTARTRKQFNGSAKAENSKHFEEQPSGHQDQEPVLTSAAQEPAQGTLGIFGMFQCGCSQTVSKQQVVDRFVSNRRCDGHLNITKPCLLIYSEECTQISYRLVTFPNWDRQSTTSLD